MFPLPTVLRTAPEPLAKIAQAQEESLSEHLGDGEDELHVRNIRQHFPDHALGPQEGALLATTGT